MGLAMTGRLISGSFAYSSQVGKPSVVTIGNFDGVHVGHQQLLHRSLEEAERLGVLSCVYTFEPPPRILLAPQLNTPRIMSWQDKVEKLLKFGIDCVIVEEFSISFAGHPPKWFAREIIDQRLKAKAVVVGHDFRYGRARAGTVETLGETLPSVFVHQISAFQKEANIVSSSRIRKLIQEGEVKKAKKLLGEEYFIRGIVVAGKQKGREIGFPTANIETSADLLPKPGVYAVEIQINRGRRQKAMVNLGMQPTFGGRTFRIEAHIFTFSDEIYGEELTIHFHQRVRAERRFTSLKQLKQQLKKDQVIIQKILKKEES
jgi:riboflavin kinase/FMN adenylyltransferase